MINGVQLMVSLLPPPTACPNPIPAGMQVIGRCDRWEQFNYTGKEKHTNTHKHPIKNMCQGRPEKKVVSSILDNAKMDKDWTSMRLEQQHMKVKERKEDGKEEGEDFVIYNLTTFLVLIRTIKDLLWL